MFRITALNPFHDYLNNYDNSMKRKALKYSDAKFVDIISSTLREFSTDVRTMAHARFFILNTPPEMMWNAWKMRGM